MSLYKKFTEAVLDTANKEGRNTGVQKALRALYGAMTGTELSGTGVYRSLSYSWNNLSDSISTQILEHNLRDGVVQFSDKRELNSMFSEENSQIVKAFVDKEAALIRQGMLEAVEDLKKYGMSGLEAQTKVLHAKAEFSSTLLERSMADGERDIRKIKIQLVDLLNNLIKSSENKPPKNDLG